MRFPMIVILVCVVLVGCGKKDKPDFPPSDSVSASEADTENVARHKNSDVDNDWVVVKAKNSETNSEVIIRLMARKPSESHMQAFSSAVEITWPYSSADQFPQPEENQRQLMFERALDGLSDMSDLSELVQITTGAGEKKWLYYTNDQQKFMAEFNSLLSGHDKYPINIDFYNDPEWTIWSEAFDALQANGA